ncbi:hypothetical protein PtA15_1A778 [Puccinia triticina]|uniref:Secreted protein n=1 Tax=Puccinia triticina TaxID=208348 RepID=A0ABY7CC01_9BASI|nr:uncharacterized protein PtA15_1A778 [Puccinia triticina]WAQ81437.1 hypothetical protein PtA15_1A778 [Puccinia triticina]WAR52321.1 hypothetical protein PtB15_1B762 [Puccinia triticina]
MVYVLLIFLLIGQYAAMSPVPAEGISLPVAESSLLPGCPVLINAGSDAKDDTFSPPISTLPYEIKEQEDDDLEKANHQINHGFTVPQGHPGRTAQHRSITKPQKFTSEIN